MRVGLFGGSFDPPHAGHLHVARTALRRLGLHRVWWLPSPQNPLKPHAPGELAERMAAIGALAAEPRMVVSDLEARLGTNRTIDVVRHLQRRHPGVHFVWIMGADALAHFHRWKGWVEIAARVPLCVVSRPEDSLSARLSPAARRLGSARLAETAARRLPMQEPPCWTYLVEPLHPHASSALRHETAD
ncbi:nicotinic acid mononucleotide adenylyltransferase [Marinicauda salina]|uniref:Probable nicotinate-nucleotide adenylyltransferase n=2 Tax=Marinicauda salina TaxID=2135793 RepID=A0A2U2BYA4_9PROT|nr:nicotinic acid mononucleotide adenylyltransferase [Marinicauda salina]